MVFWKLWLRITPAYAGNTAKHRHTRDFLRDHPRLRGEYSCRSYRRQDGMGSPPLTRGIRITIITSINNDRITPAYAGNTIRSFRNTSQDGDHPRLRGEYGSRSSRPRRMEGSPPLTRGIHGPERVFAKICGITPAYAGNTPERLRSFHGHRDHPRLRGEYIHTDADGAPEEGSPPLTRGIHFCKHRLSHCRGITPAYAGNTIVALIYRNANGDHPRLRGEYRIRSRKKLAK